MAAKQELHEVIHANTQSKATDRIREPSESVFSACLEVGASRRQIDAAVGNRLAPFAGLFRFAGTVGEAGIAQSGADGHDAPMIHVLHERRFA